MSRMPPERTKESRTGKRGILVAIARVMLEDTAVSGIPKDIAFGDIITI